LRGDDSLWHQTQDVILQFALKAIHDRQHGHQRHYAKRNANG